MRQTGRTTRMLLKAAIFVSECWQQNNGKIITIVGQNETAAEILLVQFCSILKTPDRQQKGLLLYGNVCVAFMGQDRFYTPERTLGVREKEILYFDHAVVIKKG